MWKLGMFWAKFRKELQIAWLMVRDPHAPLIAKATVVVAVLYIISPIDLIPDVLPVLGWIDDGVIAMLLLKLALKFLPKDLYDSLKARVERRRAVVEV
jgi:uncharacterized membrane protein YkvA (DUF1232 family)